MCKNKLGVKIGLFLAAIHFVWIILVMLIPNFLQSFLDWVCKLHGIESIYTITFVSVVNALLLLILAFVAGYIIGWIFVWISERCECCPAVAKKKKLR